MKTVASSTLLGSPVGLMVTVAVHVNFLFAASGPEMEASATLRRGMSGLQAGQQAAACSGVELPCNWQKTRLLLGKQLAA
jgi:hypothetical protein